MRRRVQNTLLSLFGYAVGSSLTIDDAGYRGLRELQHRCKFFQRNRLDRGFLHVSVVPE